VGNLGLRFPPGKTTYTRNDHVPGTKRGGGKGSQEKGKKKWIHFQEITSPSRNLRERYQTAFHTSNCRTQGARKKWKGSGRKHKIAQTRPLGGTGTNKSEKTKLGENGSKRHSQGGGDEGSGQVQMSETSIKANLKDSQRSGIERRLETQRGKINRRKDKELRGKNWRRSSVTEGNTEKNL